MKDRLPLPSFALLVKRNTRKARYMTRVQDIAVLLDLRSANAAQTRTSIRARRTWIQN